MANKIGSKKTFLRQVYILATLQENEPEHAFPYIYKWSVTVIQTLSNLNKKQSKIRRTKWALKK